MPNSTNTIEVKFKPKYPKAKKIIPLILTLVIILADQITKYLIVKNVPMNTIGAEFFGDFLRIIHVSNPGIAFSIGHGWSLAARGILFRIVPLIVIFIVLGIYFRNDEFTQLQRWAITGIAGGGFGNLIDRFFRTEGVVDFIDIKFYGLFGFERWPTFNVADMAVVICGILLVISFIFAVKTHKAGEDE
ncbi:MAG: signal peptidase II [Treponema sp.]|nr:signal peptidase II [Candidatus Treponema equifaecale]